MTLSFGSKTMKTTTKKKIKNLKPVECIADLRYRCTNCGLDHWVSIKEAKTRDFIIVCDCDTLLKVKQIQTVNVVYVNDATLQKRPVNTTQAPIIPTVKPTDAKVISQACAVLSTYGFTKQEAMDMATKYTEKESFTDVKILVSKILSNLEKTA
jgi:hypothetical protein